MTIQNASKNKLGRVDALKLAKGSAKVIVTRGKALLTFDMIKNPPKDDELLAAILGPTGNLRAPAMQVGKTLLIGFNAEACEAAMK